ncbi:hypothetical protein SARC_03754 [Sphaeroforma arctica JP610]|uniref:Uncharacterized protein n=1 Tax=Sphaeroforma arctica JP610 TaxID=667725 RepID=A0A0L0G4Q3_9EUKA|nr:hypothetical protein SARC_03754 [Sphaeroforma arctica JP610]KNC84020.1 hypothetical protein SARC_03754 [Sphaeroforma arctica JP610]|eukprot:XP_014157922.1 hypothetical protein SARC_03754 [Sphaeroforma arctica JP610]
MNSQEERLALGRVTAVKELTRSIDDKKAREASKNDEVPEKEGNDADDADAVDYEEEAEEADDETVEVDDKKYANKALSKYKGKQNTDPDEDDERHIRGVIQRFVDAGWDRNDPRVKAKVEAEYKVLRARKAAKFGYKFNPIVTPARSFKYSKKDLPNLFEGYKDNIVLKFSDMFAPRRELVPIGRGTKTDKNAERAFVPKPDERAIFSDFVAPKAVPKHRKAVTVEKEPTAAVDGKDGTAAGVVDVSKDAETSDAKKKKEAKPKTLKAADSVVDPSVAEFVHEAYTAQWPLLPVAQKLWEESLDWGEEDEETDKVMILDDDLNDQWKVSPPSDSETEIEEATEDGLEAVQPAIRGSSNNSSQANRISLAVPTPRPATPGPGTPGQVVPESPAGSMNGDLGGGSGPDRDNNASSNDASNSANGNNTSAGAGANNNNNNNNNNSSSFSNYNSNSISNSGGSSLSASNQLRGKSHEALEYSRVTPVNTELLYGNWDKEVVWDDSIIPAVPMATNVLLDLNDTKILFDQGVGAPLPPKIHVLEDPAPGVDGMGACGKPTKTYVYGLVWLV